MKKLITVIISLIIAANILYWFQGKAATHAFKATVSDECSAMLKKKGLTQQDLSCDMVCAKIQDIQKAAAHGTPNFQSLMAAKTLDDCYAQMHGESCSCPK